MLDAYTGRPSDEGGGRGLIAEARAACPACSYHAICPVAPLFLQTEAKPGERKRHPHGAVLRDYLERLAEGSPRFERDLLGALGGDDEGLALVAGCLLAEAFWAEPQRLRRLLEGIAQRGPQARPLNAFEEQLIRAGALLQDPEVPPLLRGRYRLKRGDREVTAYEAVRLVTQLVGGETSTAWSTEAVATADRSGFDASFVLRGDDDVDGAAGGTTGGVDLFFSARFGPHSSVFHYRRDGRGEQSVVALEQMRPDTLLARLFDVFHTDRLRTHRLFAKICRFLNNTFKELDKKRLRAGLEHLEREQQIVLALYAPRLAKTIEKRARFPGLHRLAKFLHRSLADKDDAETSSHAKIFAQRAAASDLIDAYGQQEFKEFCSYVFRLAEATPSGPQWSDLILKIGEVAYYLTALEGLNSAGLEMSLRGRNALAFVAYGLQPAAGSPARRLARLNRVRARIAGLDDPPKGLLGACDQGLRYMAKIHGFESVDAMEEAVETGAPAGPG